MQNTAPDQSDLNPPRTTESNMSDVVNETDQQEKDGRSARNVFKAFVVSSVVLFSLLYALFLGSLLNGQLSNPLFETLGLEPSDIKQALLLVTNSLFGVISLIFLIAMLVKFFQWIMTKSEDIRKANRLQKSGAYFGILIGIVSIWIGLFWLITRTSVVQTRSAENSLVITNPENLIGLTSPQVVEFDIGTRLFKQVKPENIRQIDWDFNGDGEYDASGPSVQYEFIDKGENNGRYLVGVEVRYYSEESKGEKVYTDNREVIIANEAVIADIQASPLVGQAPLAVKLSAEKSRDPDGEIMMYEWDLDGDNSYEIRGREKYAVDKVFTTLGEHTVRLRVTGRNNDFSTAETIIAVKPPDEKIRAQITSQSSSFDGLAPLKIEFDGAQSFVKQGRITKYEWQIAGEPASVLGRKIQRTFDRAGVSCHSYR
jgi:PKD repeat protein